jgi:short-subunit dehydrogenase
MSRTVLISGASSGLGAALALRYAAAGARLGLIGRNRDRLEDVARRCRTAGAPEVETAAIDVRADAALAAWIAEFDRRLPIDLTIASAAIVGGAHAAGEPENAETAREVFAINVRGLINTVHAVLPGMLARRAGQVAVVSSLAGFVALPDLPSYSASKAAGIRYGLGLRDALRPRGIGVSVACPGYIDTPMGRQLNGRKMFVVTADAAADAIVRGLARDRRIIAFPFVLAWVTRLSALLPAWMVRLGAPSFRIAAREND